MSNEKNDLSMLHVYQTAELAKEESRKRIEPLKQETTEPSQDWDAHRFDPEYRDYMLPSMDMAGMKPVQQMTIHHPWFLGLAEAMKTIGENFHQEKKLRIVIDYDPQKSYTEFTMFRATDAESPAEG